MEVDDIPIDVKYEPLAIKDEFPATDGSVYTNTKGQAYFTIKSEYSGGTDSDDAREPLTHYHINHEYDIKEESHTVIEIDHSSATSDTKLIAATGITQYEANADCRFPDTERHNCDICQQHFGTAEDLITHRYTHTEDANFSCLICRNTFHMKQQLHRHMLQNSEFNKHIRNPSGGKPYKSNICYESLTQKGDLDKHKRINTGKKHECDICHKSFIVSSYLTIHKRIHSDEKPYECDICHKSFAHNSNATRHKRIHTGERPYECDICHKSFITGTHLTNHKRIHSGEKPYECDICHNSFAQTGGLTKHILIHTGEKPYECDICRKSFARKGDFTKHIFIHTGEKPYECDICHKSFVRKGELAKHILIHTGEKPFECDICHKSFRQSGNLTTHMRRIHTNERKKL